MPFIKKYFKKDMSESIKYFLAKEGISITDSLQKYNQNVPLEEMFINKISTLEYYFVLLSELMNYTKKEKRVLREKTNKPTEKKDFLLEENKKSVIHNSDKSVKEGMALYYELIEKVLELLTSKSLRKGYVLLKREMVNDNLIMFISLYELFRYFKSDTFFLCENGYVIYHKKLNLKGEFLNDTVLLVEEKEIKRFLFNFNKL
ncbi:hypothetical protein TUBRATIS_12180 [Tubulinosema ratisbonensis]|uniref:Uncharacterized protein n=1 Tax=Tubulinosema ratisbonensis TaxID=291195 RepID=A0A437AM54_9MICR|nr:hypothetical protein TUBRATIS_12180 [Tubulinosema ratisbonensis]